MLHLGPIVIGDAGTFALASPPVQGDARRFGSASEALAFLRREVLPPQLRQIRRMLAHEGAFGRDDDEAVLRRLADAIARHRVIVLRRAGHEARGGASGPAAPSIVTEVEGEPLAPEPLAPADDLRVHATIEPGGAPWIVDAEIEIDDDQRQQALAAEEAST